MAKYVPFENLKVGETYYMYSRYWGKTLGKATIKELNPASGTGEAISDWGEHPEAMFCFGVDDGFYDDLFWDAEPTDFEVRNQIKNGKKYVPPRFIGGKTYDGGSVISDDLKYLLDDFIEYLNRKFEKTKCFKKDERDDKHLFMWESKLDYNVLPSEIFITHGGQCDWDTINYVAGHAKVRIHAGERDGFGWLTGIIDKTMPDGTLKSIFYG